MPHATGRRWGWLLALLVGCGQEQSAATAADVADVGEDTGATAVGDAAEADTGAARSVEDSAPDDGASADDDVDAEGVDAKADVDGAADTAVEVGDADVAVGDVEDVEDVGDVEDVEDVGEITDEEIGDADNGDADNGDADNDTELAKDTEVAKDTAVDTASDASTLACIDGMMLDPNADPTFDIGHCKGIACACPAAPYPEGSACCPECVLACDYPTCCGTTNQFHCKYGTWKINTWYACP